MSDVFISYARADDRNGLVKRFADDLAEELRARAGAASSHGLVFRDVAGIAMGAAYDAVLRRELGSCRAFIALLSPTYVQRPACISEWAAFSWRLERADRPPLLFPIWWRHFQPLPKALAAIQNTHERLGETYATEGLRFLMETRPLEYKEFVFRLAELLHAAVQAHPLAAADVPPFSELPRLLVDSDVHPPHRRRLAIAAASALLALAAGGGTWMRHEQNARRRAALDAFVAAYCPYRNDPPPSPPPAVRDVAPAVAVDKAAEVTKACPLVALALLDALPTQTAGSWKTRGRALYELNQPGRALEALRHAPRDAAVVHDIARCERVLGLDGYDRDMKEACRLGDRTACEAIE